MIEYFHCCSVISILSPAEANMFRRKIDRKLRILPLAPNYTNCHQRQLCATRVRWMNEYVHWNAIISSESLAEINTLKQKQETFVRPITSNPIHSRQSQLCRPQFPPREQLCPLKSHYLNCKSGGSWYVPAKHVVPLPPNSIHPLQDQLYTSATFAVWADVSAITL